MKLFFTIERLALATKEDLEAIGFKVTIKFLNNVWELYYFI